MSDTNPNPVPQATPVPNDRVLIAQNDRRKQRMNLKVRRRMHKGYAPNEYFKVLNPKDSNDLALFFEDLDYVIGAPVEKAFWKYKKNKEPTSPFF